MITKLTGKQIKGCTFMQPLTKLTLILGENAFGKSARLDALYLAALGYHPRLGKTNDRIFQLASGPEMETEIETTLGTVKRCWYMNGGKITSFASGASAEMVIPPIMLDPKIYFALSVDKRVELVAGMVDLSAKGFKIDQIIAEIKNIKIETNTEHSEAEIKKVCKTLSDIQLPKIQDWFAKAIENVKAGLSSAVAARKRMEGVVTGLEQLKAADEAENSNANNVEQKLARARNDLATMNKAEGEKEAELREIKSQAARYQELIAVTMPKGFDLPGLNKKKNEVRTEIERLEGIIKKWKRTTEDLKSAIDRNNSSIATENTKIKSLDISIKSMEKDKSCKCPTCKQDWEEKKKSMETVLSEAKKNMAAAKTQVDAATAENERLQATYDKQKKVENDLDTTNGEYSEINATLDENSEAIQAYNSAQAELKNMTALRSSQALEKEIENIAQDLTETRKTINELEQQKNEIIAKRADNRRQMQAIEARNKLESEIEVLKEVQEILSTKQAALVTQAFLPVLTLVNKFTRGLLKAPLEYRNNELGMMVKNVWISHNTFSGAEEAITYAGLCVALAMNSKVKIVVMDEMTRFIGKNKKVLLDRVIELLETGAIDQFIGVDGPAPCYEKIEFNKSELTLINV